MKVKIHRSEKLNREERIKYLETAINLISNLQYTKKDGKFHSYLNKPIYPMRIILRDLKIGLELRK